MPCSGSTFAMKWIAGWPINNRPERRVATDLLPINKRPLSPIYRAEPALPLSTNITQSRLSAFGDRPTALQREAWSVQSPLSSPPSQSRAIHGLQITNSSGSPGSAAGRNLNTPDCQSCPRSRRESNAAEIPASCAAFTIVMPFCCRANLIRSPSATIWSPFSPSRKVRCRRGASRAGNLASCPPPGMSLTKLRGSVSIRRHARHAPTQAREYQARHRVWRVPATQHRARYQPVTVA